MQEYQTAQKIVRSALFLYMNTPTYQRIYYGNHSDRCSFTPLKVGDGVTMKYFTDCRACTVIHVRPGQVVVQRDKATRLDNPNIVPGGFAGHCTNNRDIRYSYERDPRGATSRFTRRKNGRWVRVGEKINGTHIFPGRHEFYDYNF